MITRDVWQKLELSGTRFAAVFLQCGLSLPDVLALGLLGMRSVRFPCCLRLFLFMFPLKPSSAVFFFFLLSGFPVPASRHDVR